MPTMPDAYGRDLDLNLLRVFVVVAEEGSITRAAARLYVTQPAISAAMRRLTSYVGSPLFTRQGHGVVLTSRGADLLLVAKVHLAPLVAAAMSATPFDPLASTATVRVGLGEELGPLLLSPLLALLRDEAPLLQVVVVPVQFRTVEEALISGKVDLAVSVADELPRSILREQLPLGEAQGSFVCLHDPRFSRLPPRLTEKAYFAGEHVIVSYAGDVRGIVEDALGKSRRVRVSVPAFAYVADLVDGSALLATVPSFIAEHIRKTRPHLRALPLPFTFGSATRLDILWSRVKGEDAVTGYVRDALLRAGASLRQAIPRRTASLENSRKAQR